MTDGGGLKLDPKNILVISCARQAVESLRQIMCKVLRHYFAKYPAGICKFSGASDKTADSLHSRLSHA